MDALIPAVQALRTTANKGQSIPEMLHAAAEAARQGSEATIMIPARYGRAKYQGTSSTIPRPTPGEEKKCVYPNNALIWKDLPVVRC